MQTIELLAPAKNLECGIAAIEHGADAVYIGAERFGARVAAGNSVDDIRELCRYAHRFGAKVYVTVNTIVYDDEMEATQQLIDRLADAGVDAILVQDMGILSIRRAGLPADARSQFSVLHSPLSMHASTQTDNRTVEKVKWLRSLGFRRVVLARELSVEDIRAIHEAVPDVELEVFVHGALCVSYSGVCYASEYCFHRSANRGACAQFCRLKFDLQDADGRTIEQGRHLLSLKDMCRIDSLEELMEAGACSMKIEGRLKDVYYVKNVVAAYSQRLDEIIDRHPGKYCRASQGRCTYTFTPNLKKTFNRGFTDYFLHGRQPDIVSFDTPKAIGEYVGKVKEIRGGSFNVAGTASFANGDGLCFFYEERASSPVGSQAGHSAPRRNYVLEGFRVNKVVNNRLFPLKMPEHLRPGMALYRNNDQEFERLLSKPSAERKIEVRMVLDAIADGFRLTMTDNQGAVMAEEQMTFAHQPAQKPQEQNIRTQLSKLGGTPYVCREVMVNGPAGQYFIPSSVLSDLRRRVIAKLEEPSRFVEQLSGFVEQPSAIVEELSVNAEQPSASLEEPSVKAGRTPVPMPKEYKEHPYLYNIANQQARLFYEQQGLTNIQPAFELIHLPHVSQHAAGSTRHPQPLLMQCRHCLRYSLGFCVKHGGRQPQWREPLYLVLPDGKRFRLQFDCQQCQMNVYAEQ